jgi:hypothetical protein
MDSQVKLIKDSNEAKLAELKQEINQSLNNLYEEVLNAALKMDPF